jgi:hypothetical protein
MPKAIKAHLYGQGNSMPGSVAMMPVAEHAEYPARAPYVGFAARSFRRPDDCVGDFVVVHPVADAWFDALDHLRSHRGMAGPRI